MPFLGSVLLLFFLSLSSFSQPVFTHADTLRGSPSPLRSCYDVKFYDLHLHIDIQQKKIAGANKIHYLVNSDFDKLQIDLFANLEIHGIIHGEEQLSFARDNNAVFIQFGSLQKAGIRDSITIYYSGIPIPALNAPWDGGFVWSKDSLERPWTAVACEGTGASLWWPCKDHLSDEPDSMRMSFTVPEALTCVSNGNPESAVSRFGEKTQRWMVHAPINNYNVTFYIGYYSHFSEAFTSISGNTISLDFYVLDYNLDKVKNHFLQVKPMLNCYEKLFGEYPFQKDGYALVEAPYWGMEHQSAIAYGNHFRTDMLKYDYIIVHESGHEWWGNNVSVTDHGELWIHEAFTTYAEALLVECSYDYNRSLNYLMKQRSSIKNKEAILGPLNVNYKGWKDSDMYYKGSWMLHTLRNVIADDTLWFGILKGIQKKFKWNSVNSEMIIQYINSRTGQDLHYFFDQYLKSPVPPAFTYSIKKKGRKTILSYKWESDVKDFRMPYFITLNNSEIIKLNPTTELRTLEYHGKINKLEFPEKLFYVDIKKE